MSENTIPNTPETWGERQALITTYTHEARDIYNTTLTKMLDKQQAEQNAKSWLQAVEKMGELCDNPSFLTELYVLDAAAGKHPHDPASQELAHPAFREVALAKLNAWLGEDHVFTAPDAIRIKGAFYQTVSGPKQVL